MEYYKLDELENQYPTVDNYVKRNDTQALLKGVYETNNILFQMNDIGYIIPIEDTTFRFILCIKKDNEPDRYFTSRPYFDELINSYETNNPYFYNTSLYKEFTVTIDITSILKLAETLSAKELKDDARVSKNVFFTQKVFFDSNENEQIAARRDFESLLKIKDGIEDEIAKKPKLRSILTSKGREETKILQNRLSDINKKIDDAQRLITLNTNTVIEVEKSELEINYTDLVKFYDYILTKEDFSPDSAETGGVKPASELGIWKVKKFIPAKPATTDNSLVTEEFRSQSFLRDIVEDAKKIPVVGTIVKAAEAVVNVVGKAVKAVGNFIKGIFSDKRVKENFVKLATIGDVNVYKFNYIWNKDTEEYGVIAQELLGTKYESAVFIDDETGLYKVDYEKLNEMVDIQSFINQINQKN